MNLDVVVVDPWEFEGDHTGFKRGSGCSERKNEGQCFISVYIHVLPLHVRL